MKSEPLFTDRREAAVALAQRLGAYRGRRPLILAIPRGAVPMGEVLADRLEGELDLILVHKLGAPFNPEYAIGAIDESGRTFFWSEVPTRLADEKRIEQIKARELEKLRARRALTLPWRKPLDPAGRTVIVVDDGLATGATMMAALNAVRAAAPAELVCAVPVAASDSLAMVKPLADRTVCLHASPHFGAVSLYFKHFPQVEDEEVQAILRRHAAPGSGAE